MRLLPLLLALTACKAEPLLSGSSDVDALPDEALAPAPFLASLQSTSPVAGWPMWLRSYGHPLGSMVHFGRGAPGVFCPPTLGGACIDITSPVQLAQTVSFDEGDAIVSINVPALAPPGATTTLQAANLTELGYTTVISQPLPIRVEPATPCQPGTFSVVPNAHLALPLAGEFEQTVGSTMTRVFDATRSANALQIDGNENVRSLLPMMTSTMLTEAGVWVWRDVNAGTTPFTWTLYYTDGSFDTQTEMLPPDPEGWHYVDLFPSLTPRTTRRLEVWGYGAHGDITRFADFTVCATL